VRCEGDHSVNFTDPGRASDIRISPAHFQGMAKPRKPSSPSAKGDDSLHREEGLPETERPSLPVDAGDAEISLDEYEERPLQRPRLPDHRRERPSMEMGATHSHLGDQPSSAPQAAPDQFESNTSAVREWTPVTPEEIETYDPAAIDLPEEPNAPATVPEPVSEPVGERVVEIPVTPGLDDLEEFIARTASAAPPGEKVARVRRPLTLLEKVSFGAGGAVLLVLAVWLIRAVTSAAGEGKPVSDGWPDVPMEGSLVTISEAASQWRMRTDTDRVAQMEVSLPVPGLQMPDIIPHVTFTIDPGASSDGYLRFIFKDSEGKPRGDTRVVHVKGGKLTDLGQGEIIKSTTDGAVYCSYGLVNIHAYNSYTGNNQPRWSVEVAESAAYDAKDKDWKVLGTFEVRNDLEQ